MGISPRMRCITKRGRKNPRVKQDGKREFITALEAVSADGFVFPSFLIAKGVKHCFDWYKNVHEDKDARLQFQRKGLNPRVILSQLAKPTARSRSQSNSTTCILERTPYTKHNLQKQTIFALNFVKTASDGEVWGWILCFVHAAEHSLTEVNLAHVELQRLRNQIKNVCPSKKDM